MVLLFSLTLHIPIRDGNLCIHLTAAVLFALLCHMRGDWIALLWHM